MFNRKTNNRKIRIGILGCGPYSDAVADGYTNNPHAELAAFCDTDQTLAEQSALRHGVDAVFQDYHEMIDNGRIDAVEILYGADHHREVSAYACQKGKHIAIHKPLAHSTEDANAIRQAVRQAGVKAHVVDPLLFQPPVLQAKKLLDKHRVGGLESIRIRTTAGGHGSWGPGFQPETFSEESSNPLLIPAFDKMALLETLMGEIDQVFCYRSKRGIVVSLKYKTPCRLATHEVCYCPEMEITSDGFSVDESVEITGTDGVLFLRNLSARMIEAPKIQLIRKDKSILWNDRNEWDFQNILAEACNHFIRCILEDKTPLHTVDQAARALRLNEAAFKSSKVGEPVRIDSWTKEE